MQVQQTQVVGDEVLHFEGELTAVEGVHILFGQRVMGDEDPRLWVGGIEGAAGSQAGEVLGQLMGGHGTHGR
jgi:hypothetical protein